MIITMETQIPLPPNGVTVEELIEILQTIPEQTAKVRGAHISGGYGSSDSYRLDLSWNKRVGSD